MQLSCTVSVIPATQRTEDLNHRLHSLRVAAYCRVSTDAESQQNSYAMQKNYYIEQIQKHSGWKLAGIYADEGITGTSRKKRTQFNHMMHDAIDGKIDYILCKSISRFARNTLDALECVRQLKALSPPVGVFFERERIDSLSSSSDFVLTVFSSLAEEESRSISENIRWSIQRNFRAGKPMIDLNRMLGYDPGPGGEWIINEDQAAIVRYIYAQFKAGCSGCRIAKELNLLGKTTIHGKCWRADAIYLILRNEKYVGDLEMQKTYTKDFRTHNSVKNNGEFPKYYISNHHPPIIDRDTWDTVQEMLREAQRARGRRK